MLPALTLKIGADTIDLEKALSSVSGAINKLEDRTKRAGESLKEFGEKSSNLGKKMLPYSAGIAAVGGALLGLGQNAANSARDIERFSQVSNTSTDDFQRMAAGARHVGIQQEKLADIFKDVNDRVGDFNATGAGPMADFFENIAPKVGVTADQFARLSGPEALQLYVSSLEKAGVNQQDMTFYLEAMASDASLLIPLLAEGGTEMRRLGDAAAQAGAIMDKDAIAAAKKYNEQLTTLKDGLTGAGNAIGSAMMPVMLELVGAINEHVVPAISAMAGGISKAIEWFGQLPGPVQEAAALVGAALGVGGPILLAVGAMSSAIGGLIASTGPVGLFIAAASLAYGAWQIWGDDIMALIGTVGAWFSEKFTAIGQSVNDGFAAVGEVTEWVKEQFNGLMEWFAALPERFMEFGRNIITGLWDGLKAAWDEFSITDTIAGWAGGIKDSFAGMLGIQSPSRVFHEYGMNIGEGLRNGITDSFGMVQSAVAGLADQTTGGAFDMAKGVVDAMGQMFKGSKPIAMAQALINTFQGMTEALKLPFPANLAAVAKVAAQGFAAVQGISSANPGSGAGAGRSAASSAAASAPAGPQIMLNVQPNARGDIPMETFQGLLGEINRGLGRGGRIVGGLA